MRSQASTAARMAPAGRAAVPEPVAAAGQAAPPLSDAQLTVRLLASDEDAFRSVVADWGPGLLRIAGYHLSSRASAEEVVQETWIAVLGGLAGFQGRSSLRTWVCRVLINTAKARARQEARTVPVAALAGEWQGATVPSGAFRRGGQPDAGRWTSVAAPASWHDTPEPAALAAEARRALADALLKLPERQRAVVMLRDVHGYLGEEVCELLELSPANQRVLLHRGRAALRSGLDAYYAERRART